MSVDDVKEYFEKINQPEPDIIDKTIDMSPKGSYPASDTSSNSDQTICQMCKECVHNCKCKPKEMCVKYEKHIV